LVNPLSDRRSLRIVGSGARTTIAPAFCRAFGPRVSHLGLAALRKPSFAQRIGKDRNPGIFGCKMVLHSSLQVQQVSATWANRRLHDLSHSAVGPRPCQRRRRAAYRGFLFRCSLNPLFSWSVRTMPLHWPEGLRLPPKRRSAEPRKIGGVS